MVFTWAVQASWKMTGRGDDDLVRDWSIICGVGGNNSRGVHHVLAGKVGLADLSQARVEC